MGAGEGWPLGHGYVPPAAMGAGEGWHTATGHSHVSPARPCAAPKAPSRVAGG